MCKNVLFKWKTIPIEVNFLLWERLHFEFNQFDIFFVNFPQKILMVGGKQKRALKINTYYLFIVNLFKYNIFCTSLAANGTWLGDAVPFISEALIDCAPTLVTLESQHVLVAEMPGQIKRNRTRQFCTDCLRFRFSRGIFIWWFIDFTFLYFQLEMKTSCHVM